MELLFQSDLSNRPSVSIILLDWSCRESFHILHYLNKQTIPRERYEVIWIEYYGRRVTEIEAGLKECEKLSKPPIVDKWIVMEMPDNVYYHKHLMYNIGIVTSRGKIVTLCDSDAIVRSTFVESIIKSFDKDPDIVLHMDEVRNTDKRFYPFNYPPIEEIIGEGCINWKDGKSTGLLDKDDPLHTRNYGACMCALREYLINIGGADEHIDYLGHICGPYEMTFRLVNVGKKEVWHQEEFLYHVWHPGVDGIDNYLGPHDGRNMSTIALKARRTGRVMPRVENPIIRALRLKQDAEITKQPLLSQVFREGKIKEWIIDENKRLISLGKASYSRGEYDEAIQYWKKVRENLSPDSTLLSDIGWTYYHKSNYNEALNAFNGAVKLDPDNRDALRGRGWTKYQKGRYDEALQDFNKALQNIYPHEKDLLQEILRGRGWSYFHKGCRDEALQDFLKAIDNTDVNNRDVLQDLFRGIGWVYIKKGSFNQAKEYFNRAIENIDPKDRVVMDDALRGRDMAHSSLLSGEAHFAREEDKGMGYFKSGLLSDMGWAYYHKSNYNEALKTFNEAVKFDHNNHRAFCGRGWAYLQKSRFDEAIRDFDIAIVNTDEADKNSFQEALRGRGWAYYNKGNFKEAIEDFNKALNYTDENDKNVLQHIYHGRSWAYYRLGRINEAVENFKRTRASPPSNPYNIARIHFIFHVFVTRIRQRLKRI